MASDSRHGSDELGLIELIKVLATYKLVVVGVAVGCLVIAVLIAFLSTPVYRSEIQISAVEDSGSSDSLASLLPGMARVSSLGLLSGGARRGQIAEGIATLKSPQFTIEFISENDLMPILFAGQWNAETADWAPDDPEDIPTLSDGHFLFEKQIRTVIEGDDGIITLAIEWRDPELSAAWANEMVRKLNLRLRTRAIEEADQTLKFLQEELGSTNVVEIQQAIYSMMEHQIKTRTVAKVRDDYEWPIRN